MKLLGEYQNGNYIVSIYNDGTKIRETEADKFIPDFPECMDVKITNQCDMGCPYCHENSTKDGLHGDILHADFINTLNLYTELALGGGNPLSHPDLIEFLSKLKEKKLIANITVNQTHFIKQQELIGKLVNDGLIKGLGVSLTNVTNDFIELIEQYPNAVIHVINGVVSTNDLKKLYDKNLKMLILGYKLFRRGNEYYSPKVELYKASMYQELPDIIKHFKVVSFDNLAIDQLNVKRLMSVEDWNEFYMGDDGQFTMYIDLVNRQFARSSVSTNRYDLKDNIVDMFDIVRNEKRI
jgi:MoaA/NifB/PqqE/SkfB family radical SAM enzyme